MIDERSGERGTGSVRSVVLAVLQFLCLLLGAVAAPGAAVLAPLGVAVVASVLEAPWAMRRLLGWRFLGFLALLVLTHALWWPEGERGFWGCSFCSRAGLLAGLWMAARATTILLAAGLLAATTSVGDLTALFSAGRWRRVGLMVGVAANMLPVVQRTVGNTWIALRLRGGFRRRRWRALQLLATSIITNLLQYADDVVCSAESRALGVWWNDPSPSRDR